MKAMFYVWCVCAAISLVASFFNYGHVLFSLVPSVCMAFATYPDTKEEED